jgi:hypothetical protein
MPDAKITSGETIENREGQIREVAESVRRFLQGHESSLMLARALSVTQEKPVEPRPIDRSEMQ